MFFVLIKTNSFLFLRSSDPTLVALQISLIALRADLHKIIVVVLFFANFDLSEVLNLIYMFCCDLIDNLVG